MNQTTFNLYLVHIIHVVKYIYIIHIVHSLVHRSTVPKVDTTNYENHFGPRPQRFKLNGIPL